MKEKPKNSLMNKIKRAYIGLMLSSEGSNKQEVQIKNFEIKMFLAKFLMITSFSCLFLIIFAGVDDIFTLILIWFGFTIPFGAYYLLKILNRFSNKIFKENPDVNIIIQRKQLYALKATGFIGLLMIFFGIAIVFPYVIGSLEGDSFVHIIGVTAFLLGCLLFLLLPLPLILCTSGIKLYNHGIVSGWKPVSQMFSSDPYFIPFSEIKTIGIFTLCLFKIFFIMDDGTVAYCEISTDNSYSSYSTLSKLLDKQLHLKCPEAERFEFSKMKELKTIVTGKPNGRLKKYKPPKNRIKQIP